MSYFIVTANGQVAQAIPPSADRVLRIADAIAHGFDPFPWTAPASGSRTWDEDNSDWVLPYLSGHYVTQHNEPGRMIAQNLWRLNRSALLAVVEAYQTRVIMPDGREIAYEQTTDGATWYPDEPMLGCFVRSWWAVAHDLLFDLNHAGASTVFGRHFTFDESAALIADCSKAQGDWIFTRIAKVWATSSGVAKRMWDGRQSVAQINSSKLGKLTVSPASA